MAMVKNQKLKLLYLMKIFLKKTDDEHMLTIPQLIEELKGYGVSAERKSLYGDIEALRSFGLDIVRCKSKTTGYFVAGRTFELPELKILADAVASSRFLTEKKSAQLIGKIESLASEPQAKSLQRQIYVRGRVKNQNEKIYYNVDTINQAIAQKKPVSFRYFEYCIDWQHARHWKKRYRRNGQKYHAFPYALLWDSENYYMTAYYEKYGGLSNFRVDKMDRMEIIENGDYERSDLPSFDAAEYSKEIFGMHSGKEENVTLRVDNSLIGVVLDRFGEETEISRAVGSSFYIRVKVIVSPMLLSRIFEFGGRVEIVEPKSLIEEYSRLVEESLSRYRQV
jgi:predicted DNA-binding transcriptional regulator YafY